MKNLTKNLILTGIFLAGFGSGALGQIQENGLSTKKKKSRWESPAENKKFAEFIQEKGDFFKDCKTYNLEFTIKEESYANYSVTFFPYFKDMQIGIEKVDSYGEKTSEIFTDLDNNGECDKYSFYKGKTEIANLLKMNNEGKKQINQRYNALIPTIQKIYEESKSQK